MIAKRMVKMIDDEKTMSHVTDLPTNTIHAWQYGEKAMA